MLAFCIHFASLFAFCFFVFLYLLLYHECFEFPTKISVKTSKNKMKEKLKLKKKNLFSILCLGAVFDISYIISLHSSHRWEALIFVLFYRSGN